MLASLRASSRLGVRGGLSRRCLSSVAISQGSRSAAYRTVQRYTNHDRISNIPSPFVLRPNITPFALHHMLHNSFSTNARQQAISFRDLKSEDKPKEQPKSKEDAPKQAPEDDPAELAYQQATKSSREKARQEWERQKAYEEEMKEQEEGEQKKKEEQRKERKEEKSDEPPPPPHGNKSPWHVFTETLRTEFKASKEWNESTKQLASSANAFTQNESIKKAREAYTAASDKAGSGAATAFKTTGKAIGQSATWTWGSAPVKGLRDGVSAAGRGLDKATKPIRDTKAFKSVQNVVDDGSSSRYGGWIEKEERKKRREQRELEEATGETSGGRRHEKMEEDPECVPICPMLFSVLIIPGPAQT